jgi:uncharacterized protein DUF2334
MRYVIIRDDDTNAFTPVRCLEQLYRPFLERGLPVNLATIPEVATGTTTPDGKIEGFLNFKNGVRTETQPLAANQELTAYLKANRCYQIVQHGLRHDYHEFDRVATVEVAKKLEDGTRLLMDAGFSRPKTFVAPYDKLSRESMQEAARQFRVISTGWFELGRLPVGWWPRYALKKMSAAPHWQVGRTVLLTHPGCLLSCFRPNAGIMDNIIAQINRRRVTVLVTHWWEYFREGKTDDAFIGTLHETAAYIASRPDIKAISFSDLVTESIPLI